MKATIKLITSQRESKIGFPIVITVSHKGAQNRKTIGHSKRNNWNFKTELPLTSHLDYDDLYPIILNFRAKVAKREFKNFENIDVAFGFLMDKKENKRVNFYELAEKEIEYMYSLGRDGNAVSYNTALTALRYYKAHLYFDEIDTSLIENFKRYKKLKCKNSTIRAYLAALRAIYNSIIVQHKFKDKEPFKRRFIDIPTPKRRVKNVYINKESIKKLELASLVQKSYQRTIDLTLLQFYLGGADLIDIYYLKNDQIHNNRVYFIRKKRRSIEYEFDLKIFDRAWCRINKYRSDGKFVFPWRKDKTGYETFRSNHIDDLDTVIKLLGIKTLPKNEKFTTKSVRHSFKTIGKFLYIEEDIIRELMGHERNDIDTAYADLYPEEVRDAAHLKIIG